MSAPTASSGEQFRWRRFHPALEFGALGLLSGSLALGGLMIAMELEWLESLWVWQTALPFLGTDLKLGFHPLTLLPGVIFGVIIGIALLWHRLANASQIMAYVLASGMSSFAATNLAMNIVIAMNITSYRSIGLHLAIGMIAGLFGAACLTALTVAIFPFSRRLWPCLLMLIAGALLGGVLAVTLYLYHVRGGTPILAWVALYTPWQAGFAAPLAPQYRVAPTNTTNPVRRTARSVLNPPWRRQHPCCDHIRFISVN